MISTLDETFYLGEGLSVLVFNLGKNFYSFIYTSYTPNILNIFKDKVVKKFILKILVSLNLSI